MSERPASALAAPASLPDDEDILREILLRLPPLPSSLPRASLVSNLWRRIVSDPHFRRRFRARHKVPPLLGFFCTSFAYSHRFTNVFVPALGTPDRIPPARFSFPPSPLGGFRFLGCRHGLALLEGGFQAVVWDPVTNSRCCIDFPPEFKIDSSVTIHYGAVLRDCDSGVFQLVMISYAVFDQTVRACIYDSESGKWGNVISTVAFSDCFSSSVLVGNTLYWLISQWRGSFIQIEVDRQTLAVIQMSEYIPIVPDPAVVPPPSPCPTP